MVYNSGQTGIDDVRIETGNLLPADYPDAQITKKLNAAFSKVQLAVERDAVSPFVSTDVEYYSAVELELKIAAMNALKPYAADPNIRDKITELRTEINEDIIFLKGNLQVDVGDTQILTAVTPYLSYGASLDESPDNPDLETYRSGISESV